MLMGSSNLSLNPTAKIWKSRDALQGWISRLITLCCWDVNRDASRYSVTSSPTSFLIRRLLCSLYWVKKKGVVTAATPLFSYTK